MLGEWVGHLGGGLMLLFLALLVPRCAGQLGLLKKDPFEAAGRRGPSQPAYRPGAAGLLTAFFGVLAVQWAFALLCWLTLRQPGGLPAFLAHFWQRFTTAGDSPHYLLLARQGYVTAGEDAKLIVFYPLYPLLIRLAHTLLAPFGAGWELSALLCSQLCWGGAGAAMLRLAGRHFGREQAFCAVLMMALYPFGFFSLGVFTESLFLLLCLLCISAAGERRWPAAGLFCALAGLCRTQGLALLPALGFLWLRLEGRRLFARASVPASSQAGPEPAPQKAPPMSRALFGLLLMPLGYLGYLLLNAALFGDPLIFMQFQSAPPWYQSIRWIGPNLTQHWQLAHEYPGLAPFIYHSQLALYFVGMAFLLWGLLTGRPVHWLVWGGGYTGMCYLSSWLISGSRYMFGCLPLFLLAASIRRRPLRVLLLAASGWALFYFGSFYMQGQAIM